MLHEAFWTLADIADPWLLAGLSGFGTWETIRQTGADDEMDDEFPLDPSAPLEVMNAATDFIREHVPACAMHNRVINNGSYLANFAERGNDLIPFDDEDAWKTVQDRG